MDSLQYVLSDDYQDSPCNIRKGQIFLGHNSIELEKQISGFPGFIAPTSNTPRQKWPLDYLILGKDK